MPKPKKPVAPTEEAALDEAVSSSPASPASSSFDPPDEPQWHQAIAEAAYHLAERRGFAPGHELEDWLAAEESVKGRL